MRPKINVLFPMAGDGTRFGGQQFKPFLDGTEYLFIELAKQPFDAWKDKLDIEFFFAYRQDQEERFNVTQRLHDLFPKDTIHCCILDHVTLGPLDTTAHVIKKYNLEGSFFICDCDHAIDVTPMVEEILTGHVADILVPTMHIREDQQKDFGKVVLDTNKHAIRFAEKEQIPLSADYTIEGLVGCYFVKDIHVLRGLHTANFSDMLPKLTQAHSTCYIQIQHADLFGTPESLTAYRYQLAKKMTFFVDIDGTLFYLPKHVSYDPHDIKLLPGTLEKLQSWKNQGHTIVLTTGRTHSRRDKLEKALAILKVPYDQLVTNLRPGPRILINDKKPYSDIHAMARAIQLKRNKGIDGISIEETPAILSLLKGGSFASVYLIEKDGKKIVRKYIYKSSENQIHYETLRRQFDDLNRFSYYSPGITPKMLGCYESENDFYYDMEYLDSYQELSHFSKDTIQRVVPQVMKRLSQDIYCYKKPIDAHNWYQQFLQEKIYPKYAFLRGLGADHREVLDSKTLRINGIEVPGLVDYFSQAIPHWLLPTEVSPIHGDLTLENILYNESTQDFRLIDTSGSRYVDVKEMDLSKLLQSLVAKYETWDTREWLVKKIDVGIYEVPTDLLDYSFEDLRFVFESYDVPEQMFHKALFFLSTYLIRMTPFLEKKSNSHSLLGMILTAYYLEKIFRDSST